MQTLVTTHNFKAAQLILLNRFIQDGAVVHPANWQGIKVDHRPEARMVELQNVNIHVGMPLSNLDDLAADLSPLLNREWSDAHFAERVSETPMNPGTAWSQWPDSESAKKFLDGNGQFNHNYMERFWPRYAGQLHSPSVTAEEWLERFETITAKDSWVDPNKGIRGELGDLDDIVMLLTEDPLTRQAYLPIFFPEDTALGMGNRKPCTLGYQWMLRDGKLNTYYPMRSCDYSRHWADDVYMAIRLTLWILDKLRIRDPQWNTVGLGSFTMHCTSLHMFINDFNRMKGRAA